MGVTLFQSQNIAHQKHIEMKILYPRCAARCPGFSLNNSCRNNQMSVPVSLIITDIYEAQSLVIHTISLCIAGGTTRLSRFVSLGSIRYNENSPFSNSEWEVSRKKKVLKDYRKNVQKLWRMHPPGRRPLKSWFRNMKFDVPLPYIPGVWTDNSRNGPISQPCVAPTQMAQLETCLCSHRKIATKSALFNSFYIPVKN